MNSPLTTSDMLLRVFAAMLAGALVGLERETRGRPAGFRTTILTCVAAAISMIISEFLFNQTSGNNWRPDPGRLGAGILTGIGFLGAGTIIRHKTIVLGVTTAASLWFVTVIGLAFGSGMYLLGTMGVAVALITLLLLPRLERHLPNDWYSTLTVGMQIEAISEADLQEQLHKLGLEIRRTEVTYDVAGGQKTVSCDVRVDRRKASEISARAIAALRQLPGVLRLEWH